VRYLIQNVEQKLTCSNKKETAMIERNTSPSSITESSSGVLIPATNCFSWDPLTNLGFIMKGPSSSHTAGPNLLARQVFYKLGGQPSISEITLFNSLGDVWFGHGTVGAIIAGLLGYGPSSKMITKANENPKEFARDHGLDIHWFTKHDEAKHPNALYIDASTPDKSVHLFGESLGGGRIHFETT
jgi:iron-sulfur-dependent L-serine dehydratase beta subunit